MPVQQKKAESNYTLNAKTTGEAKTNLLERIKEVSKPGGVGIIRKEKVNADKAYDLLLLNHNNRPIKNATVEYYKDEMLAGNWQYTPQSKVAIDTNGNLINGQHTLWAIFASKTTQILDIETGFSPESFKVLDKGRLRTSGDVFALEGIKDPNKASAAASFIITLLKFNKVNAGGTRGRLISDTALVEWIRDDRNRKRLGECIDAADELYKQGRWLMPSIYAGMLFILGNIRRNKAEEFLNKLASGEDISRVKNSPIFFLRKVLEQWDKQSYGKNLRSEMKVRYIITAWNWYVQEDQKGRPLEIDLLKLDKSEIEIPKIKRN